MKWTVVVTYTDKTTLTFTSNDAQIAEHLGSLFSEETWHIASVNITPRGQS